VSEAVGVLRKPISTIRLRAGSSYMETGGLLYTASQIIIHSLYDEGTSDYDIAVIKVCSNFNCTHIQCRTRFKM
jgi:hypothetical protein